MTGDELADLANLPFLPDDIYDSGPTFAVRSLAYARALPEQELLTRQELVRLEAEPKGELKSTKLLPLSPMPPQAVLGVGKAPRQREVNNAGRFAKPRLKPLGRPPGSLNRKKRPASLDEAEEMEVDVDEEPISVSYVMWGRSSDTEVVDGLVTIWCG